MIDDRQWSMMMDDDGWEIIIDTQETIIVCWCLAEPVYLFISMHGWSMIYVHIIVHIRPKQPIVHQKKIKNHHPSGFKSGVRPSLFQPCTASTALGDLMQLPGHVGRQGWGFNDGHHAAREQFVVQLLRRNLPQIWPWVKKNKKTYPHPISIQWPIWILWSENWMSDLDGSLAPNIIQ